MYRYIIAYDLHQPGQSYDKMEEAIRSLSPSVFEILWHANMPQKVLRTTWIVETSQPLSAVHKHMWDAMDQNDKVLVAEIGNFQISERQSPSVDDLLKFLARTG